MLELVTDDLNSRVVGINDELRAQVANLTNALNKTNRTAPASTKEMQAQIDELESGLFCSSLLNSSNCLPPSICLVLFLSQKQLCLFVHINLCVRTQN